MMNGTCDPRFAAVADAFGENFADGLELGAACAVVLEGRPVVDVWAGEASTSGDQWTQDTLVDCRSATKALTAVCLHVLAERGLVDLEAPVRRYWPELRSDPTVRQALSHQAGIPVVDGAGPGDILHWDRMAAAVAAQEPMWEPGEKHGYHGVSFGWLVGEPIRRVTGRSVAEVFAAEVASRLGLDCRLGTAATDQARMATLVAGLSSHHVGGQEPPPVAAASDVARRMYAPVLPPLAPSMNDPAFRSAAIPVTGASTTAMAMATLYDSLAGADGTLLREETVAAMAAEQVNGPDAVLGVPVRRSLGFELTPEWANDGRPPECFGHPGGGGVATFADPRAGLGFAYLNNAAWGGPPGADPRATRIVRALYESL